MRIQRTTASDVTYQASFKKRPTQRTLEALDAVAEATIEHVTRQEERDRFVTMLMDTAQHWNIYAAANQEHPERVAAGLAVDQVCRELAKEVRAWSKGVSDEPTDSV